MFLKNQIKKRLKNEKGLTLVELLAVIVILAIIAAIAIPAIGNIIDNSRYKAVKSDAINVLNAAQIYFADNPDVDHVSVGYLLNTGYLENAGEIHATNATTNPSTASANDSVIDKETGGNELTTTEIDYGGQNKITFSGATISEINAHTDKTSTTVGQ